MAEPNGRNGLVIRTLATIFGTLICAGVLGIFGSTWAMRGDMHSIELRQTEAVGELRLLLQRIETLSAEVATLRARITELERGR